MNILLGVQDRSPAGLFHRHLAHAQQAAWGGLISSGQQLRRFLCVGLQARSAAGILHPDLAQPEQGRVGRAGQARPAAVCAQL